VQQPDGLQALEKELEAARSAAEVQAGDLKDARNEVKVSKNERAAGSKVNKSLENQVTKLLKQVDELKGLIAARDTALRQVSEQVSAKEREHRAAEGDLSARNVRLNRALEEVQRYRRLLEDAKVCRYIFHMLCLPVRHRMSSVIIGWVYFSGCTIQQLETFVDLSLVPAQTRSCGSSIIWSSAGGYAFRSLLSLMSRFIRSFASGHEGALGFEQPMGVEAGLEYHKR
jgi:hypothetical protein